VIPYLLQAMDIKNDDAAFVLGKLGATKRKIERVSGARLELDDDKLEVFIASCVIVNHLWMLPA